MHAVREALARAGFQPGDLLALTHARGATGLAWHGGSQVVAADATAVVAGLSDLVPRWVWWSARETASSLVATGLRPDRCWDLDGVGAMLDGSARGDLAGLWAASHGLEPPASSGALNLFDIDHGTDEPVTATGQLSPEWLAGGWTETPARIGRWAELALTLAERQRQAVHDLGDPPSWSPTPGHAPLRLLVAHAESATAQLAVELEHDGLPVDRQTASDLLRAAIGERPVDAAAEQRSRTEAMRAVLREFPGDPDVDLRSPQQVRELLARIGLDLPDTRSWRLEPHASSSPAVAALLAWRRADRLETTYGWRWLDTNVGEDGRLRGRWYAADGGAGRMTAGVGLHNLPAELRPAVRAEPGHVLVRADLGQIEPRVLAAVSEDAALAAATADPDLYAPVAARLGCDRPTAKISVLAAMYGQTSGAAGQTLRAMERTYPQAMAYLHAAEAAGRERRALRTFGGRLITFGWGGADMEPAAVQARGRYGRNAVIQGAAAELFKAWAATVRHACRSMDASIVMCLHDELVLHVADTEVEAARRVLVDSLAATARWWAAGTGVRLVAEVTTGESWAQAH